MQRSFAKPREKLIELWSFTEGATEHAPQWIDGVVRENPRATLLCDENTAEWVYGQVIDGQFGPRPAWLVDMGGGNACIIFLHESQIERCRKYKESR